MVILTWKDHLMVMESTDRDDAVWYAQGKLLLCDCGLNSSLVESTCGDDS